MTRNHRITRILAVLTALCLLLSAVPAAPAAAGEAWQEQTLPYAAKLRAGVAFCADPELTEETGILQQDAVILVTEIRGNAARITYTVQKQNKQQAWVRGKYLIMLSAATPTDLDPQILDDDVQLAAPAVPQEEEEQSEQPTEDEPADEPAEEEPVSEPAEDEPTDEPAEDEPSADDIPADEDEPSAADNPVTEVEDEPVSVVSTEEEGEIEESPSEPLSDGEPAEDVPASPAVIPTNAEESPTDSDFTPNQENESPAPVATPTDIREEEAPSASENEDEISEISFEEITAEPQSGENPGGNAVYTITEAGQLELADYENPEYVTEDLPDIRDQGNYDTCWAFAAIGGLEAYLTKQNNAATSIDLSEFFLLYFSAHNFPNPKAGGEGDEVSYNGDKNYLMNGGFSRLAYHILATLIGTTSESDNPYPDADGADQQVNTNADIAAQITGAYNLDIKNTSLIKQQIIENGSVKVSVYMPKEENYNKIVNVGGGKAGFKSSTSALYGTYAGTNHDVLLIGWNDEYGTENFMSDPRPSGKGAWKARNSWGSGWGISGEFWISYEDASLLSGQAVSFTAENDSDKMADYCYSYDKGLSSSAAVVKNEAVISQSFTVDGQEVLHSIGIETTEYTDKDSGKKVFDPMSISAVVKNADGQVIASTGNVDANYSGFYLLNLKDPCVLNAASTVEVVVTCKTKQTDGKIAVLYQKNKSSTSAGKITMTASTASSGVSVNGTKNLDTDNPGSYCDSTIKLYTKRNNSAGLVESVSLNKPSLGLKTGESETLQATITPSSATNQSLRWYSSDTSIATVDENGKVVGKAKSGTAVITAVSSNGKSAACNVEVVYQNLPVTKVKISGFDSHTKRIDHSTDAGIKLGDILTLTAVLTPEYTTQPGIEWKSSNPSVLFIEKTEGNTCTIRLKQNGSATITLQSTENTSLSDWVDFTVYLPVLVSTVELKPSAAALWEGENKQLTATALPENAENKKIKWSSSDPAVATVNDMGVVTGVKDGTAVITAASEDENASASCVVLVSTQDQIKAFVYRMYRVCLLREPDDIGFVYWIDKIRSGQESGAQVAFNFFFSNEMIARNLSDTDYVERAYESILGRSSDAEGKAYWMQRLQVGFSRKALISGFVSSNEFSAICARYGIERGSYALTEPRDQNYGITAYVSRLYTKMQGRVYDVGGLNYWCNIILKNPKKEALVQVAVDGFMHSNEFKAKNLSNTEFVKVMYRTFLDREAEPAGLQYWLNKLASGMTRENVAAGFAASDEFGAIMARYGF